MRGATLRIRHIRIHNGISIHAPLAGSDKRSLFYSPVPCHFNPRSPCGERPAASFVASMISDFNPRSPCGERHLPRHLRTESFVISIHAPLAGSDPHPSPYPGDTHNFNPRSPCGERLRRAKAPAHHRYFNPRSPCGERLGKAWSIQGPDDFNPRSPCGERLRGREFCAVLSLFQSTLPLRGATRRPKATRPTCPFQSTLPLRGATRPQTPAKRPCLYFNPRSPCGERPLGTAGGSDHRHFNPRSPCGERRGANIQYASQKLISIHAPLAGSDSRTTIKIIIDESFQSTLPLRGATAASYSALRYRAYFNPRSPCGERHRLDSRR